MRWALYFCKKLYTLFMDENRFLLRRFFFIFLLPPNLSFGSPPRVCFEERNAVNAVRSKPSMRKILTWEFDREWISRLNGKLCTFLKRANIHYDSRGFSSVSRKKIFSKRVCEKCGKKYKQTKQHIIFRFQKPHKMRDSLLYVSSTILVCTYWSDNDGTRQEIRLCCVFRESLFL